MAVVRGFGIALATVFCMVGSTAMAAESPLMAMFDGNHDGRVNQAEYQTYMDKGFQRMDANGDGILKPGELPSGTHHDEPLTLTAHHRHVARQFQRQDVDHDGYLDARELMAPPR